jgi:hypothetical protein
MALRTAVIGVRATKAEHAAWEAAAKADGRSLSSWIARRCNGQPATAPALPPEPSAKRKVTRKRTT